MAHPLHSLSALAVLAPMILFLGCAQTPAGNESGQAAAAPGPAASATASTERVICEETPLTGSRLNVPRRCRTVSSSDALQREAAQGINEVRQNQATPRK